MGKTHKSYIKNIRHPRAGSYLTSIRVVIYEPHGGTGKREINVETDEEEPAMSSVLERVSRYLGREVLDYAVIVNGRELKTPKELEFRVSSRDNIVIFMPVSGG
jgi:molybdopterin converting factor small subunit